ncbi:MAG: hypothetical protein KGI10_03735 [Thaumarchaeota archaeon]|nr:hypothetical protein [Nitrososphaerota archaeon]
MEKTSVLVCIVLISSIGFVSASADNVLTPGMIHAMVSNPVSVFGNTYNLQVDNKTYPIYYGFHTTSAVASDILLVPEHNSVQISLKNMTEVDTMWVYIPQAIISADGNNFVLYVDGQNEKYELATSGHSTIMGFTVAANAHTVEIQGTSIIPEFPISMSAMAVGFLLLLIFRFYPIVKK